jgi:hypothetical protein
MNDYLKVWEKPYPTLSFVINYQFLINNYQFSISINTLRIIHI